MQVVQVSFRPGTAYTYRWDGDVPLAVGESVAVPAAGTPPSGLSIQLIGQVVKIGSDYAGPLVAVTERIIEEKEQRCYLRWEQLQLPLH